VHETCWLDIAALGMSTIYRKPSYM